MARITIKDLKESVDLDRQAMAAITGGARLGGRQPLSPQTLQGKRIVDYPPGLPSATGKKPAK